MSYLSDWSKEYLLETPKYSNHVKKFIKYIDSIKKGDSPINITKQDVIDSVEYYNSTYEINTITSMENHIEGIKAFYKYLLKLNRSEDIFADIYDYSGWKKFIANKYNLKEVVERDYLSNEIIIKVLVYLDEYFKKTNYSSLNSTRSKERYVKNLGLRIFIKLMLIAPAKRNKIFGLTFKQFSNDFRQVVVNNVVIKLTNSLHNDIKFAIEFSENITSIKYREDSNIFQYIISNKCRAENFNSYFKYVLVEIGFDIPPKQKTYSVEVIGNTGIINMVKNGTNPVIITKISGISLARLEQKYYKDKTIDKYVNSNINQELSKMEYYNYI